MTRAGTALPESARPAITLLPVPQVEKTGTGPVEDGREVMWVGGAEAFGDQAAL